MLCAQAELEGAHTDAADVADAVGCAADAVASECHSRNSHKDLSVLPVLQKELAELAEVQTTVGLYRAIVGYKTVEYQQRCADGEQQRSNTPNNQLRLVERGVDQEGEAAVDASTAV